jgi:hypothetical protein
MTLEPEAAAPRARRAIMGLGFRPLTIVMATGFSLLGSLGQFFIVDSYDSVASAKAGELQQIERSLSVISETQSRYFMAYSQSNMLFAINPEDIKASDSIVSKLYTFSLLDRAFPIRALLAEMSIAGKFPFKPEVEKYEQVTAAARANFTLETNRALTEYEQSLLQRAFELQDKLQERHHALTLEKADAETARETRRGWLVGLTAIGTLLLLAANLMADRRGGSSIT